MKFNENLKYLRKQEGLTQEQLAERLNVSRQAITKWEAGQSLPDITNIMEIASMFGVTLDELLKDEHVSQNTTLNKKIKDLPILLFAFAISIGTFILDVGLRQTELVIAAFMLALVVLGFRLKRYFLGREIIDLTDTEKGRKERNAKILKRSIMSEGIFLAYMLIVYISRKIQGSEIFERNIDLISGTIVSFIIFPIIYKIDLNSRVKKYKENND